MKLNKPIRINSNLSNGGHLSCGVNAIISVIHTLGYKKIDLIGLNKKIESIDKEVEFGGLFKVDLMEKILKHLIKTYGLEIHYEIKEFNTSDELDLLLKNSDAYGLVCYYALQGFVRVSEHPRMEHAHYGIIYEYNEEARTLSGSQSNSKGDMLKCLENVGIDKFVESCNCVNKLKVNWGKYNKCKIEVCKSELEDKHRCGSERCRLGLNDTCKCLYRPSIGNKIIFIKRKS